MDVGQYLAGSTVSIRRENLGCNREARVNKATNSNTEEKVPS
jgi:hypothetical protein